MNTKLDAFTADMTDDQIHEILEGFTLTDIRAIADGRLRLNDRSELDNRLWSIAIDVENERV